MANFLTAIRLFLIIPTALGIAEVITLSPLLLLSLILVAILTDYFDGKVARKLGTASPTGMLFDHATDFLFVTLCLLAAAFAGKVTFLLPLLIAIAFSQYVIDSYFYYRDKQLRMSKLGRWNGILYFIPVVLVPATRIPGIGDFTGSEFVSWVGWTLVMSTVISILDRAIAPSRTAS